MKKLKNILAELHPEIALDAEARLVDDGILDSIDIVTLIGEISDAYGIDVPVEEITPENFASADSIYKMIQRLRGRG